MSDSERIETAKAVAEQAPNPHEMATFVRIARSVASAQGDSPEKLSRILDEVSAKGGDRLQLIGKMAEGGMSQVHLAVDRVLQRRVAAKIISPQLKNDPLHARLFVREAQIISQLDHPSIAPLHDMGVDGDGRLYFTMKLVRGRTLQEKIRELPAGPIEPTTLFDLLEVIVKVCDALSLAHSRGVIHCDVKPSNIMVGDYGEVYLMDWGIAHIAQDEPAPGGADPVEVRASPDVEDEGMLLSPGTLGYMSPEQVSGEKLTPATDVFCLGAVMYEIVTRRPPYRGASTPDTAAMVRTAKFAPPEDVVGQDEIPPGLRHLILTAMAAEPENRYASAAAFKEGVLRLMRGDAAFERKIFASGEVIAAEGDAEDSAYIIESGRCDVYRIIDGQRRKLGELGPGDVFGEMAVLTPAPRHASVVATQDVVAQVAHGDVLERELDSMQPWMGRVVKRLAARLRDISDGGRSHEVTDAEVAQQVVMYLCTWGERSADRALSSPIEQVARALHRRTGNGLAELRRALTGFPGLQIGGDPQRVVMRDPPATLRALWRADEVGKTAGSADHRQLAEQVVMYLCAFGRLDADRSLRAPFATLAGELTFRTKGDARVLRAAIGRFPDLVVEGTPETVVLQRPKSMLEQLWPK